MTLFSAPATPPVSVRGRLLFSAFLFRTLIPIFFVFCYPPSSYVVSTNHTRKF